MPIIFYDEMEAKRKLEEAKRKRREELAFNPVELGGPGSGFYGHAGRDAENLRGGSVARGITPMASRGSRRSSKHVDVTEKQFYEALDKLNFVDDRTEFPGLDSVRKGEEEIRYNKVEYKKIYTKDGVLIETSGGTSQNNAGRNDSAAEQVMGGIVTHNHPVVGGAVSERAVWKMSFSDADYKYAAYYNLKEMRVVGPDWVAVVSPPETGWPNMANAGKSYRDYRAGAADITDSIMSDFIASLPYTPYSNEWKISITNKRDELEYFGEILVDQQMARKYGLTYKSYTTRKVTK